MSDRSRNADDDGAARDRDRYCPKCRGVWLDRGELDKLIEGGSPAREEVRPAPTPEVRQRYPQPQYKKDDEYYYKKKKKDSFLKDFFDF